MSLESLIPLQERHAGPWTVVPLHATGGDENQLVPLARQLAPGAHILAPRGQEMEGGHTRRFFRRRGMTDLDVDDLIARADELAGALGDMLAALGTDRAHTLALGYSNGANIALGMMFRHAGLFGAAALLRPMLPYTPEDTPDLSGVSVLVAAGEADPFCPPDMTRDLVALLERAGADVEVTLQPVGHEITRGDLEAAADWVRARLGG
jgi:phospholipase/carboxylesterase